MRMRLRLRSRRFRLVSSSSRSHEFEFEEQEKLICPLTSPSFSTPALLYQRGGRPVKLERRC